VVPIRARQGESDERNQTMDGDDDGGVENEQRCDVSDRGAWRGDEKEH
jgi:hypothetical protein